MVDGGARHSGADKSHSTGYLKEDFSSKSVSQPVGDGSTNHSSRLQSGSKDQNWLIESEGG